LKHSSIEMVMLLCIGISSTVRSQWVQTNGPNGGPIWCLAVSGTNLFAGTDSLGAFRSADSGSSWAPVDFESDVASVNAFARDDSSFYAWTGERSLYYSADDGQHWHLVDTALCGNWYPARTPLFLHGGSLFANRSVGGSLSAGAVYRSIDHGATWVSVLPGLLANTYAVQDSVLLVAGQDAVPPLYFHLYRSSDNGLHWATIGGVFQYGGLEFAVHDGLLFSGGFGISRSSDHGVSWMSAQEGYGTFEVSCFAEAGGSLFAGTWTSGVYVSTDDGVRWIPVNEGLNVRTVTSLAVSGTNLFAGTFSNGVWRRPLSEFVTSVGRISADMPARFTLEQNYPNPFNPTTTIRYALPQRASVSLIVYNTLGQQVATLVNDNQDVGYHEVRFNGSNLSSGVYFYRLQAGAFVEAKKFVLVR
jgi:hypothetical protein